MYPTPSSISRCALGERCLIASIPCLGWLDPFCSRWAARGLSGRPAQLMGGLRLLVLGYGRTDLVVQCGRQRALGVVMGNGGWLGRQVIASTGYVRERRGGCRLRKGRLCKSCLRPWKPAGQAVEQLTGFNSLASQHVAVRRRGHYINDLPLLTLLAMPCEELQIRHAHLVWVQ